MKVYAGPSARSSPVWGDFPALWGIASCRRYAALWWPSSPGGGLPAVTATLTGCGDAAGVLLVRSRGRVTRSTCRPYDPLVGIETLTRWARHGGPPKQRHPGTRSVRRTGVRSGPFEVDASCRATGRSRAGAAGQTPRLGAIARGDRRGARRVRQDDAPSAVDGAGPASVRVGKASSRRRRPHGVPVLHRRRARPRRTAR